jgi:hypothetical protein
MLLSGLRVTKKSKKSIKYSNDAQICYTNKYHNIAKNFCRYKEKVISLKHVFDQANLMHRN